MLRSDRIHVDRLMYIAGRREHRAKLSIGSGLATEQQCTDLDAGPIYNQAEAEATCPNVCSAAEESWNGQWTTTQWGVASVCGCCG